MKEKDLQPIIGEFVSGAGYIDVIGKIEDDDYMLEIIDGYNHTWFYDYFDLSKFRTIEEACKYLYERIIITIIIIKII